MKALITITMSILAVIVIAVQMNRTVIHIEHVNNDSFCMYSGLEKDLTDKGLRVGLLGCFDGTPTGDNKVNNELANQVPHLVYVERHVLDAQSIASND